MNYRKKGEKEVCQSNLGFLLFPIKLFIQKLLYIIEDHKIDL